ncbi:MAG: threonine synthase [Alphaproteobacteria bacterium]
MKYISTRGSAPKLSFSDVLLAGLAEDGGLYIPETYPQITADDLARFKSMEYVDVAFEVIKPYVETCINDNDLKNMLKDTYKSFSHKDVAPIIKLKDDLHVCELFHGPTIAFKDFALQLLGRLFDHVLTQRNEKITIVGATSGDTGSAAIEACKNRKCIDIFILHPLGKTSDVQRYQMTTVDADNVHNIALKGTFDDCQDKVKELFNDKETRTRINLSAVNSINWARIMTQIVYYVYSASRVIEDGKKVSFSVPTGNFGNVLAGYFAMKMGVPVDQFMVASNSNDILTRFLIDKDMSMNEVVETHSPSMDIQISSNFERLAFESVNRDDKAIVDCMSKFRETGKMPVPAGMWENINEKFQGMSVNNDDTLKAIKKWQDETGIIFDPHSVIGVEAGVAMKTASPVIAMATAHPAKFPDAIQKAVNETVELPSHMAGLFDKQERYDVLENDYDTLVKYILDRIN